MQTISKNVAINVLNAGLATGADFAEIYFDRTISEVISLTNGNVEKIDTSNVYGVGIRLLKNFQSVYGYTNDISTKNLLKLATTLSKSFSGEQSIFVTNMEKVKQKLHHQSNNEVINVSKADKIAYCKKATKLIQNYDYRIVRTDVNLIANSKDVLIFNSDGKEFVDHRSRGRIFLQALASQDGKIESGYFGPGASKGMEFFLEDINLEEACEHAASQAIVLLNAEECPSGVMPVIIGNGFGGVIFHEACGHGLEASGVSKNLSIFSNKLGEQVASPLVSAVDDGTIENGWGSGNIDDEGTPTQRTLLIENGILKNYLIDNFNGRRMNMKGNGACRRQNYKYEPTSRMSNTFICGGTSTVEEMIAATEYGLYAKNMGGGSVNPATGDFNFAVAEGYIIKNGKIDHPVKGATLIGNGGSILKEIDMVGNDLLRGQGMCGASSGSIPADVGQPTIRLAKITVGGRGGSK